MMDKNSAAPELIDKDEPCFYVLRGTCDNVCRDLAAGPVISSLFLAERSHPLLDT